MRQLGLTQIETQRGSFKCREGLLIDFDYGTELTQNGQESQSITLAEVNPANEERPNDDDDDDDNEEEEEDQGEGASKCAHVGQTMGPTCVRTVSIYALIDIH